MNDNNIIFDDVSLWPLLLQSQPSAASLRARVTERACAHKRRGARYNNIILLRNGVWVPACAHAHTSIGCATTAPTPLPPRVGVRGGRASGWRRPKSTAIARYLTAKRRTAATSTTANDDDGDTAVGHNNASRTRRHGYVRVAAQ